MNDTKHGDRADNGRDFLKDCLKNTGPRFTKRQLLKQVRTWGLTNRRGKPLTSQAILARHRITPSMSRTGDCWDNAPVESFFSSFKAEASPARPWPDLHAATTAIDEYVAFYNHRRLHSTLNYQSPAAFEARLAVTV